MNIAKELLIEKAKEGYTVCYADTCPLRTQCLRWLVGQQMPHTYSSYRCVNPAKGMTHTFTGDMPKRLEPAVRNGVIHLSNRTYYFEYRNGSRLISTALQEKIRKLFHDNGWTEEVMFDGYVEDYDW